LLYTYTCKVTTSSIDTVS